MSVRELAFEEMMLVAGGNEGNGGDQAGTGSMGGGDGQGNGASGSADGGYGFSFDSGYAVGQVVNGYTIGRAVGFVGRALIEAGIVEGAKAGIQALSNLENPGLPSNNADYTVMGDYGGGGYGPAGTSANGNGN